MKGKKFQSRSVFFLRVLPGSVNISLLSEELIFLELFHCNTNDLTGQSEIRFCLCASEQSAVSF